MAHLFRLGNRGLNVSVTDYKGYVKVHLRYHHTDPVTGKMFPTKAGVILSPEEWGDLKSHLKEIDETVEVTLALLCVSEQQGQDVSKVESKQDAEGLEILKSGRAKDMIQNIIEGRKSENDSQQLGDTEAQMLNFSEAISPAQELKPSTNWETDLVTLFGSLEIDQSKPDYGDETQNQNKKQPRKRVKSSETKNVSQTKKRRLVKINCEEERRHACSFCNKRYAKEGFLKKHINRVHKESANK